MHPPQHHAAPTNAKPHHRNNKPGNATVRRTIFSPKKLRSSIMVPLFSMLTLMGKWAYTCERDALCCTPCTLMGTPPHLQTHQPTSLILYSKPLVTPLIMFCVDVQARLAQYPAGGRNPSRCTDYLNPPCNTPLSIPQKQTPTWMWEEMVRMTARFFLLPYVISTLSFCCPSSSTKCISTDAYLNSRCN